MNDLGISGLVSLFLPMLAMWLGILLIVWIYSGFAYSTIAKKAKLSTPGLAWIPLFGPAIIAFQTSQMHWWPWLLLIGTVIPIPLLGWLCNLFFFVKTLVWHGKMFVTVGKPDWWGYLMIIPPIGLIMVGIAAWSQD